MVNPHVCIALLHKLIFGHFVVAVFSHVTFFFFFPLEFWEHYKAILSCSDEFCQLFQYPRVLSQLGSEW